MTDNQISGLELAKLKAEGAITEAEYGAQKALLLGPETQVPFYRKLWVVVVLTVLVLTMPLALLILATGSVYKGTEGGLAPISGRARAIYAGVLVLWLAGAFVNAVLFSDTGFMGALDRTAQQTQAGTTEAKSSPRPQEGNTGSDATAAPEADKQAAAEPAPAQTAKANDSDGPPACTDPKVRQAILDGMQLAFDKYGVPFDPSIKEIFSNLEERDTDVTRRYFNILTNPTDGQFKPEEVRICQAPGLETNDLGVTAIIKHDGHVGGYILNSGLRTPVPFGDPIE